MLHNSPRVEIRTVNYFCLSAHHHRYSDSINIADIMPTIYLISAPDARNSARWCFLRSVVPVSWLVFIVECAFPAAVIGSSMIFSLLGWVLWTTFHWCCHTIMRLELLSYKLCCFLSQSLVLLYSSSSYCCDWIFTYLFSVGLGIMDYISLVLSLTP